MIVIRVLVVAAGLMLAGCAFTKSKPPNIADAALDVSGPGCAKIAAGMTPADALGVCIALEPCWAAFCQAGRATPTPVQ